ncbi:MAG: DUF4394 domain-containing protein [Pyrinomonadaceae bacterium]
MSSNQRSSSFTRVKGLAIVSVALALLMTVTTFGAGASHFAFIDSVTEFFGLQRITAPAAQDVSTNEIRSEAVALAPAFTTINVSLPNVTATPGDIVVPITVSDTTGEGILAYDIQVTFDPAVVLPNGSGFDEAGTLSSAMSVSSFTGNSGHLIISGFDVNPLAGAGTLLNLKFTVQNNLGASTNLTFEDYTDPGSVLHYACRFNEGTPASSTTNGSVSIPAATATNTSTNTPTETATSTSTSTDTPTATATNTFTPTATSTETFTPTSTATFTATSTATFTPTPAGPCGSGGNIEAFGSVLGTAPTAYATLSAAFAAVNAGTHTGAITMYVCANTTEPTVAATPSAILNASGTGSAVYTSMSITPNGGAARTISGAATTGFPLIDLVGADNVTINGLNTGGNSLTIANTLSPGTTGTSTIRFIGGATSNTITNCNLQGSKGTSVATNGATVTFSTDAVTANGNDNNTISNNNIGPAGANLPTTAIQCNGSVSTTAIGNSGLIINNNNIFDYFGAAVTSAGVAVNNGCNTSSITNNRFYQTGTRTWTTGATHTGIAIASQTAPQGAQGFTITGNTIGYASSTQTGTYTLTGSTGKFQGIRFDGITTGTVSNINNNTIASVSMTGVTSSGTGSTSSPFSAILVNNGLAITNGNTIGSQSATGSLTFSTTTTTSSDFYGIYNFSFDNWTANSNNIGGMSITNLGASGTMVLYGLRANTGAFTFTGTSNNVGGTVANSMSLTSTGAASQLIGMLTNNAISTWTSNTVRNLTNNNGTGTTTSASVIGMSSTSTTPVQNLSQNTIHTLTASSAANASVVTGIQFAGGTGNVVERNLIYNLLAPTTSASAEINGIRVAGGTTTYRNNMIALGANQAIAIGAAASNGGTSGINGFNGVLGTDTFVHNSVYIGGTATSGLGASYALNGTQTVNARSFRDNIFQNSRTNGAATGKHYAVKINGTAANPSGLTINNNVYFANGASGAVFGFFNSLDVANLTAWKAAVGQDAASFESNPQYNDPTNATPDLHLHPTNATVAEGNGVDLGVVLDYDGQTRSGLTPVDIGADAGNFTGLDLLAPSIVYTPFANTSLTTNRVLSATITDAGGVAGGALAPRIYFKKSTDAGYVSTQCVPSYSCTIDYTLVGGGSVTSGNIIQYFVVAQDTVGNLASNPSGGFSGTDVNNVTTPPTPPNSYTISIAFSGPYNVGTGETYTSLTNPGGIFEAINGGVLTGNVTLNITTDLTGELGTHALNEWVEEGGSGYTMLIKPSGAPRTITGSNTGALIRLNGADRVRIDGSTAASVVGGNPALRELTIQNTNVGTGAVVISIGSGTNGAQNDTIQNVNVLGQDPTTTLIGIALGGTTPGTAGTDNDNNRVENCSVRRAIYGIFSAGASLANQNTGSVITQNDLSGTTTNRIRRIGIVVFNESGVQITENSVGGIDTTESADAVGIGVGTQLVDASSTASGGVTGALVARNKVNGVVSSPATFSAAGIAVSGAVGAANTLQNNMVTGVNANATSPDIVAGIHVFGVTGSTTRVYNNSVSMTGDRGATASQMPSYGISITGTDPTVELKNNIFYTTQIASGGGVNAKSYAIGMVTTTFANLDSNYNDFWSTGANDGGFRSGSLAAGAGTDYAALAAWQTATGGTATDDFNSLESDPSFTSPLTDLHIPYSSTVVNIGTTIASVTNDFDGDTRPQDASYEIGADEVAAPTPTSTATNTPTPSNTDTATPTPTETFTPTATDTPTDTPTATNTATSTATATQTATPELIYGKTTSSSSATAGINLVSFSSNDPATITVIGPFTGLTAGQTAVRTIDFRPATGTLYAISTNGSLPLTGQLYTVNLTTAALTPVGSGFALGTANSTRVEMDFNPVVDRIRLITAATGTGGTNNNFRINPNDGTLVNIDANLAYDAGDPQAGFGGFNMLGVAYTNNVVGATTTTLYSWDYQSDSLVTIGGLNGTPSPNTGLMFTVNNPGTFLTFNAELGMDISGLTGTLFVTHDDPNTGTSMNLYTRDLTTGVETLLGAYPGGTFVGDLSVNIPFVPPSPTATSTATNTPTPTNTDTPTPTSTATDTPTPTSTATATATETFTPTATSTATNTATPTPPAVISGTVTYGNALGSPAPPRFVSNVLISAAGSPPLSDITDGLGATAGQYSLTGFGAGSYTITPSKTGGVNGAVNSFDSARIAQHVASIMMLTGNQLIVADTSGVDGITSFDAALVARYVVALPGSGSTGNWIFLPSSRNYPTITSSLAGEDYSGLLMGEVSGNWVNTGARPAHGPERSTSVAAPRLVTPADNEVIIPVSVQGAANKDIIAYEFDLRYDPTVIQPQAVPVDLAGTVSSRLTVAVNTEEAGLLRVAIYGPLPIDDNGLLMNLRFNAVGAPGSVSPLVFEKMMFNEGDPGTQVTDGQVELTAAGANQAEISGRLLNSMGQGIPNARVTLTDTTGQTRTIVSNGFGVYRFGALQVGQTYTISVESRSISFAPVMVSITGPAVNVDVIAEQ